MSELCICITNWEAPDSTQTCVAKLLGLPDRALIDDRTRIVVADNSTTDDSSVRLTRVFRDDDRVAILRLPENRGYGAAMNAAIEYGRLQHAPLFFLLLNNDTVPLAGSIDALLNCAREHPSAGAIGPTMLETDAKTIQCAGGCYYSIWSTTYRPALAGAPVSRAKADSPLEQPIDYVSGAAMLVRDEALNDVGPLPTDYFLYFEELDLAERMRGKWTQEWCPGSLVLHAGGASIRHARVYGRYSAAVYFSTRSALQYTTRYHHRLVPVAFMARFIGKLVQLALRNHLRDLPALVLAYWDFYRRAPYPAVTLVSGISRFRGRGEDPTSRS